MKNKKLYKRILAFLTAGGLAGFQMFCVSGVDLRQLKSYRGSKLNKVIVTLKSKPLSQGGSEEDILLEHKLAKGYLKSFYPWFKADCEYSELINGFSCELPEELMEAAKECGCVSGVENCFTMTHSEEAQTDNAGEGETVKTLSDYSGEGQVIAVLDTELDTSHDMFKPIDGKAVKLKKSDISKIVSGDKLNAKATEKVYVNSKIPFAYSYTNEEDPLDLSLKHKSGNHGTHVCGIAAGNETNSPKGKISGMAPDAQLVFMGVFTYNSDIDAYFTDDSKVIAALEDAVKLKADVINMSFGEDTEVLKGSAYDIACKNAVKDGIAVFAAAGNFGSCGYCTDNPDDSTLSAPSSVDGVISVACCTEDNGIPEISTFSSKGVSEDLSLKPDMTELGEEVYSAFASNTYERMSGTSMAAPRAAGLYLLLSQRLSEIKSELKGREKTEYIKNVMMNSAELIRDVNSDGYVSPRYQGAGLVRGEKALECNALLTSNGVSKVNLYDKLGTEFELPLELENTSGEDILFKKAELIVMTDGCTAAGAEGKRDISGSKALKFTANLSLLKSVGADEKKSVSVKVKLDEAQLKAHEKLFTNGFFIEGFVRLSGADNSCDISIPFLGFHGDWGAVPIFACDDYTKMTTGCSNQVVSRIGEDLVSVGANHVNGDEKACGIYISPNGDELTDVIGFDMNNLREAASCSLDIYDKQGNKVYTTSVQECINRGYSNTQVMAQNLEKLNDGGEYTAKLSAKINYKDAAEQSVSVDFKVDKTAPEIVKSETKTVGGRKILHLRVKDESCLDGIVILGKGLGGLYRSYDPSDPSSYENKIDNITNLTDIYGMTGLRDKGFDFADTAAFVSSDGKTLEMYYDITDFSYVIFTAVDGGANLTKYLVKGSEDNREKPEEKNVKKQEPAEEPKKQNEDNTRSSENTSVQANKNENPTTGKSFAFAGCAVFFAGAVLSRKGRR